MGQGTESCGGYDVEYDPYEEGLANGMWTQRDGSMISVEHMSISHLNNALRLAEKMARSATFSDVSDMWGEWVDVLERTIQHRSKTSVKPFSTPSTPVQPKTPPQPVRGAKIEMICHCTKHYMARQADLNRGWGLSCSKRCASIRREFNKPPATRA